MTVANVESIPEMALSVRQPWAWAILFAGKDIENRTKHAITLGRMGPGRIALHAAKTMLKADYAAAAAFMARIGVTCPPPEELVRGAIVGAITVTGTVKSDSSRWFMGPWGLLLRDPTPIDPIPAQGQLGYFEWSPGGEIDAPKPWMLKHTQPPDFAGMGESRQPELFE